MPLSLRQKHCSTTISMAAYESIPSLNYPRPLAETSTTDNRPHRSSSVVHAGAAAKDLLKYLATFEHTLAVMQDPAHIERVAFEAVEDLANDGVVYAEFVSLRNCTTCHSKLRPRRSAPAFGEQKPQPTRRPFNLGKPHHLCDAYRTSICRGGRIVDRYRPTESKVIAFDLAGAETGWPPSLHGTLSPSPANVMSMIHASEP